MDNIDNRLPLVPGRVSASTECDGFLAELTELSAKHGIAITGTPVLFVMEREDFSYAYRIDDGCNLSLG